MKHYSITNLELPETQQNTQDEKRFWPIIRALHRLNAAWQSQVLGLPNFSTPRIKNSFQGEPQLVNFTGSDVIPVSMGVFANAYWNGSEVVLRSSLVSGTFVAGKDYYLQSNGQITSNPQVVSWVQYLGKAISDTHVIWHFYAPTYS